MATINLRDFYLWYTQNEYIEVPYEIAEELRANAHIISAYPFFRISSILANIPRRRYNISVM